MVGAGLLAAVLLETLLGGFTRTGASTNTGWFALIVALMCIPFGSLLLTLGSGQMAAQPLPRSQPLNVCGKRFRWFA